MRRESHILEMRANAAAEEEMQLVIGQLAKIAKARWPNLFQDSKVDANGRWSTENRKI